jgi:putative SOS response-associated peptidase YedK
LLIGRHFQLTLFGWITTNQAAIIALFRVINRYVGNLAPMTGVLPDYPAPVIRNTDAGSEMVLMRWGMPPPPRTDGPPATSATRHRRAERGLLKPENRCLERLAVHKDSISRNHI